MLTTLEGDPATVVGVNRRDVLQRLVWTRRLHGARATSWEL